MQTRQGLNTGCAFAVSSGVASFKWRWAILVFATLLGLSGCGGGEDFSQATKTNQLTSSGSVQVFSAAPTGTLDDVQSAQARSFIQAVMQSTATSATNADELFAWAERNYPTLFPPGPVTQPLQTFEIRYYPSTDLYLGVSQGRVYMLGARQTSGRVIELGSLSSVSLPLVVQTIEVDRVAYGRQAVFRLAGASLDAEPFEFSVVEGSCPGLSSLANSKVSIFLRCVVQSTGPLTVRAISSSGAVLAESTYIVPAPRVAVATNLGTLVVELLPEAAPVTVNNFLRYVSLGFYNETIFHRLEKSTIGVIQGGIYLSNLTPKTGLAAPIELESNKGLRNIRGTIAMARASDPNSATSQFYFNITDNPGLDYVSDGEPGYAVFGRVVQGEFVLDLLSALTTVAAPNTGFNSLPTLDPTNTESFGIVMRVAQIQ